MADLYGLLLEDLFRGRPPRVPRPFNPDHLLWRAGEHGLHGLTHAALEGRTDLPPELLDLEPRLRAFAMAQEAVVRHRLAAAREVAAALRKSGVPGLFFKGVALSVEAYGVPGHRPFSDLDLLVAPASLPAARAALSGIGYAVDPSVAPSSMEERHCRDGAPGPGIGVDLHVDLVERGGAQGSVRIPVGEVVDRRHEAGGVPVPAVEDGLLLCAVNLVRSRMDRLVLVADFDRLAALGPRWEAVLERARAWRLRTSLWLGLHYSERMFGTRIPGEVLGALEPPGWRRGPLLRVLEGSFLWLRRKFKAPLGAALVPRLCRD